MSVGMVPSVTPRGLHYTQLLHQSWNLGISVVSLYEPDMDPTPQNRVEMLGVI